MLFCLSLYVCCPAWYPCAGTNIRYLFDDSFKGIFNAAVAHCNNMPSVAGTTIAVPQSLTEDTCLYGIRPGDGKGLANWIGVRKIGGVWRTFDNRTLIYTNWRSAANPSNDCAVTYPSPSEKGQWNKIDCTSNTRHTVCERGRDFPFRLLSQCETTLHSL